MHDRLSMTRLPPVGFANEINFGTLDKRTTAVVSCLVDIFMTILLLLKQTLFKHIGDAKGLQILVEVPR